MRSDLDSIPTYSNATDAQPLAFEDTRHWGPSAEPTYAYLTNTARHEAACRTRERGSD